MGSGPHHIDSSGTALQRLGYLLHGAPFYIVHLHHALIGPGQLINRHADGLANLVGNGTAARAVPGLHKYSARKRWGSLLAALRLLAAALISLQHLDRIHQVAPCQLSQPCTSRLVIAGDKLIVTLQPFARCWPGKGGNSPVWR